MPALPVLLHQCLLRFTTLRIGKVSVYSLARSTPTVVCCSSSLTQSYNIVGYAQGIKANNITEPG